MANIEDYLDWRSDVPFELDPFNEVDNLIFSEIAYTPFEDIVKGPGLRDKISLGDASKLFFEKYDEEEIMKKASSTKVAPFIMRKMAGTKRYSGVKLAGYVNELDADTQSQFSVVSFFLPDNTIYVAFRGTDDTLIGWREDYNMSFSQGTGGQLKAVQYLNSNFSRTMRRIRVGGHSKGGNFAVYGSAFCKETVKDNIIEVYSNDGPGFVNEIVQSKQYQSIKKRVKSTIPNHSIIGMLMENDFESKVILSDAKGIDQHNPMTWQISRNRFITEPLSETSVLVDEIIKDWVVDFDYDTRTLFGDILFTSLESGGQTKLSQLTGAKLSSVAQITKSINSLSKEQQAVFYDVLKKLANVSSGVFKDSVLEKITSLSKSEKKRLK